MEGMNINAPWGDYLALRTLPGNIYWVLLELIQLFVSGYRPD